MKVVSVRTGKPKQIEFGGRTAQSAIFKSPVDSVIVGELGLDGDSQVEPVHGGPYKAVYAYTAAGYEFWEQELGRESMEPGSFGENLTIDGLVDSEVCSGDRFLIGEVELMATTPRIPCFKLEIRLEAGGLVERFLASDWPGIYFKVIRQGVIANGDPVIPLSKANDSLTMVELVRLYSGADRHENRLKKANALTSNSSRVACTT